MEDNQPVVIRLNMTLICVVQLVGGLIVGFEAPISQSSASLLWAIGVLSFTALINTVIIAVGGLLFANLTFNKVGLVLLGTITALCFFSARILASILVML